MSIPFFATDLFADDRSVLVDTLHAVATAPDQRFILGERTAAFEAALAASLGGDHHVIACSSGTSALELILRALGIGPGDEVVVPALGCAPLAACTVNLGATPVFADVHPDTMVVDPDAVRRAITTRTRALLPAHLFSVMADMPAMRQLADEYALPLVEDSAVAQGGVLDGRPAGCWGDAGLYSFVQVKTFGTAGEGGAIVTADAALAERLRALRNHGQRTRYRHEYLGVNSRFDEVQATFQLHRLPGLPALLARRAATGDYYTSRFAPLRDAGILAPPAGRDGRCFYVYTLLADDRDELAAFLAEQGIDTHVYYPRPLPAQPAFARYAPAGARWPHAERAAATMLSVPIHPRLTDGQIEHIADAVCGYAATRHRAAVGGVHA